jgi:hypothetical protein
MRVAALVCLLAAGCTGAGTGAAAGALYIRSCRVVVTRGDVFSPADYGALGAPAPFDLKPGFFVAQPLDDLPQAHPQNRLYVRVQHNGQFVETADALTINVARVEDVAALLGQADTVGPATNERASLGLNDTCPGAETGLELDGTITWTAFGGATSGTTPPPNFRLSYGDHLAASFAFQVVDRRAITLGGIGGVPTAPAVQGNLSGNFDFFIRASDSAQAWP